MGSGESVRQPLGRDECLSLLRTAPVGRFVYTVDGLPAVQLVAFVVDGDQIIFRTHEGSRLVAVRAGTVVAFQADDLESRTGAGWSVTVVGKARILDAADAARYARAADPWDAEPTDVVAVTTELIDGYCVPPDPRAVTRSA